MSSFHLRPVPDHSPSPPSSASTTTAGDHSPLHKSSAIHTSPQSGAPRRPLSPSSLRDVNLTQDGSSTPRKYPAPPTGHELMALFPPAPPANFAEMRPGPTSGFFQRQERAFFAQAGREIVRVRVEIDVPQQDDIHNGTKSREPPQSGVPRSWPQLPPHPQHHSPIDSPMGPYPHHSKQPRSSRSMPTSAQPPSMFPVAPHGQPPQPPLNLHSSSHHSGVGLRSPPHDVHPVPGAKVEIPATEDYREDSDDAWRRPTPYADRRRAGKHTKRIVVRN
ncbi:hypothetical protein DEU56DRAFT_159028 [Suillus clintonianus]|uniref:uncharacterized protein n=1 Tax=Suillus clintonianus TaxID=1904413 RepID=UPI001B880076|nr:uncharacterized protein DEU56DRAFT_159028 [Suillus clintonianus]KAG2117726.1 hypothetical protein DEU56DRAFT_159028 [Suillus clintonianus]